MLLVWAAVCAATAAVLLILERDASIVSQLAARRGSAAVDVCRGLSFGGTYVNVVLFGVACAVVLAWSLRALRAAVVPLLAIGVTIAATTVLKQVIGRARPPASVAIMSVDGFSMPSGHASSSMAAAISIALIVFEMSRRSQRASWGIAIAMIAVAMAIGLSRPCLGVHYLSDVLMGWALGTACAVGVVFVVQRWSPMRAQPRAT